ncbi:MAG: Ig-like domain-containing protein [Bacteroidia bacterium]|nr:Ig-like domain-containing protein [Bacteroidia bacterium]MDW8348236.1 Ig-like domain-containing protein [Bacteroidia bacterium]
MLLLPSCAHVVPLTGGEIPKRTPKITYQNPEHKATNVPITTSKITLKFDCYIKCNNPQQEFFISPPILPAPEIEIKSKSVEIKLKTPLQPNTCYTIQTNGTIQEYYSATPLPPQNIVFSTGNQIDTLTLTGKIRDELGKKIPTMYVCAYTNIPIDSIGKITPHYVTQSKEDGSFVFKNIRQGSYYLLALKDVNNNFKKDLPNEITAILPQKIQVKDTIKPVLTVLHEVGLPVKVQQVDTLKNVVRVTLSKGILRDSTRLQGQKAYLLNDHKKVYFTGIRINEPLILRTVDSMGTPKLDTLKVNNTKGKWKEKATLLKNSIMPNEPLIFYVEIPIQWHKAAFEIYQDKKRVDIRTDSNAFEFRVYPKQGLWQEGLSYQIRFLSVSTNIDTTVKNFTVLPEKNFGGITGKIQGKKQNEIYYFASVDIPSMRYKIEGESFSFTYLNPGNYHFICVEDANQDGIWNGGSFEKKELPEKIRYSKVYNIRPNWIYEEEVVKIP